MLVVTVFWLDRTTSFICALTNSCYAKTWQGKHCGSGWNCRLVKVMRPSSSWWQQHACGDVPKGKWPWLWLKAAEAGCQREERTGARASHSEVWRPVWFWNIARLAPKPSQNTYAFMWFPGTCRNNGGLFCGSWTNTVKKKSLYF